MVIIRIHSSILEYHARLISDLGSIGCLAKNDVGLQQQPCRFLLIPAGMLCYFESFCDFMLIYLSINHKS